MKKILFLLAALTITGFASGCHDRDRRTPITTSTTTEESSTRVVPSSTTSTVVHSGY